MAANSASEQMTPSKLEPSIDHQEGVVMEKAGTQGDVDIAAQALQGQNLDFSEEVRKIDWRILPLAAWSCGLQFVDKSALGAAATYGLRDDLHLVGQEYSWCVSMFYFGYLAGSFVSGRALQYFHAGKVMGFAYFAWGLTLLGCMGAQNFATLMALRFLLGCFESALVPGLLLVTTMWYTPQEQPFRFGLWTVTNGILPVPFLVIYWGLGQVTGGPLYFCMPDNPITARWLNDREKAIAVKRLADCQNGVKNARFKWEQVREAVTDYHFWMIVMQMFLSQAIGNVTTNFLGIIIKGFGYTALTAQLFTAPNYAAQAFTQILVSAPPTFLSRFQNYKQPLTAAASIISLIGIIVLYITPPEPQYQSRRLGAIITISCAGVNYTVIMSVIGANVAGFTKKQVTTSMTFFLYCIINIITPQTFLGSESPSYPTGLTFVMATLSAFIVLTLATWGMMQIENIRRDKLALTNPAYTTGDENDDLMSGLRDETDRQNKHFRYSG
ncbi:unnamed protein product [Clonostachys rhizophaga]|uniref:Uncharacterized protein n=1 Tax=Clonostachys rhizophaga TaxID=160324 RepID=A0A9N9VC13_9HYPO|nr:unnamed protein product [Clonostachys rhizophaga]